MKFSIFNTLSVGIVLAIGVFMVSKVIQDSRRAKSEPSFDVIGISARTSNAAEMSGAGVIGALWQRFFAENIAAQIPNKIGYDLIAVYTDAANGKEGEYTVIIGA